ncbi:MAG: hypothetical protein LQ344_004526 [Seirophora lacunosa]|nr:MAG: hypothetical protein LQ344_004526 [Seirophora lacunosa]
MDCDELDRVLFSHPIYDAEPTGSDPFWYRGSLNTGYQFRLGPRDPDKPQPSCRIDLDESGDYDPSARRRKQLLPPVSKRERAPPQTSESEEPLQKKPRPLSWQNGRFNGLSLPVTLTLVSERGRALLENRSSAVLNVVKQRKSARYGITTWQAHAVALEAEKSAAEDLSTEEQPDPASTSHSDPGPDPIAVEQQSPTDLKAITTRLPQPVLFNQEPPESCSWCVDPLHGLLGLGIVHPLVHDTPSGYIELSGGHIAEGYLPSRMCVTCTLDRFRIVGCEGHEMHKLDEDAETNRLHAEDALESFVAGQADWEWCCICPRPAVYGCGRPTEGFDDEEAVIGCGLRLCEKCAETITSECEGDLETLVAMKMSEAEGREDHESIVRADADLLTRNGELLRRAALL